MTQPDTPRPPKKRYARIASRFHAAQNVAVSIVFFFLIFISISGLIHFLLPDPAFLYAPQRSEKLALIDRWSAQANFAVFGTSRFNEGFDPHIFDQSFSSASHQVHSLNLALQGGSQTEQRFMAQQFIRKHYETARTYPSCPAIILLELNSGLNFPPENRFHPRAINLYNWDVFSFVYDFSDPTIGLKNRVGRVGFAILSGVAHYTNVGMLSSVLFSTPISLPQGDNWRGMDIVPNELVSDEDFAHVRSMFDQRNTLVSHSPATLQPGQRQLVLDLMSERHAPFFYIAYVVTPTLYDLKSYADFPKFIETPQGHVPIFNFARPDLYPTLYKPENWRNTGHLSLVGAKVFTHILADELKTHMRSSSPSSVCGG